MPPRMINWFVIKYILVLILSAAPGSVSDSAGSSTHGCENNCLNSFRNMVSGMTMQVQACRYVSTYYNCLQSNCLINDLKPYIPPASQVLSSYDFTCDLSSTVYDPQSALYASCVGNCESAYQSLVTAAVDQAPACHAARSFLSCIESSCHIPSSSCITDAQRGLISGGFSYCDLSSSASDDLSPEVSPEDSASSSAGSSTLSAKQLTALGALLFAAVKMIFVSVWSKF